MVAKMKLNDNVYVIAGKDVGRQGQIISLDPDTNRALVSGINIIKKHQAPRSASDPGGIIEKESLINCSNLKIICPSCNEPTRIGFKKLNTGKKVRFCKRKNCNEAID